jgi:hypothetical protein
MIAAMAEDKKKRQEGFEDQRLFMEGVSWDFVS